jgi:hypothetical protein
MKLYVIAHRNVLITLNPTEDVYNKWLPRVGGVSIVSQQDDRYPHKYELQVQFTSHAPCERIRNIASIAGAEDRF